jgi:hypothetical protein
MISSETPVGRKAPAVRCSAGCVCSPLALALGPMTYEECLILDFLRAHPETAFARKEIARRAVKRPVYEANQHWADIPLAALVSKGLVEIDESGFYRLKKPDDLK